MTHPLEQMLIETEGRYLKSEEIEQLKTFIQSWPQRVALYRSLRDQEDLLVNQTLSQLRAELPNLSSRILELCQRDLCLTLRYSAQALLTEDEELLKERLVEWLEDQVRLYDLSSTYEIALRLLQQTLKRHLSPADLEGLRPYVTQVQVALIF